ncbi:telomerase Cajal body protein 1 homolog [Nomia melanderi]|uniref:telomerase Cajal body protein 1 homolog n=1 Tax=Nomia melanderi TaxID=2448451 RepID=UPI0013040B09|nr:telomerase Cajal body protein 1 [Nomia melanderi]
MENPPKIETLNEITSDMSESLTQETALQEEINTTVLILNESRENEILNEKLEESKLEELQDEHSNTIPTIVQENNTNIKEEVLHCINHICYKWDNSPKLLCETTKDYQPTELCENFTKGCQWSPDGTCLLVPSEDFRLRIYELPQNLYSEKISLNVTPTNITPVLTMKEGGLIYDTCWYPFMNSWEPATCCFLSTSRESPIHLWDAFNGELRATYRAYNQVDEVEASISVQFIDSAREIWAGFKNALRTFEVERPGRQISTIQFKKDFPNVTGLVSCIRENPIMPGLIAFGTYSKYIGLYKNGPLCSFKTGNGVTQIEFSPCGTKLFSAVRRSGEFLCWDLRNPGTVLYSLQGRQSDTNQRIYFNITSDGKQIVSGGIDGSIIIWELLDSTSYTDLNLTHKIKLSTDCINGVSLHNSLPILATSTGQRLCDSDIDYRDNNVRLWYIS